MRTDMEDQTNEVWPSPAQVVNFPSRIAYYDSILNKTWYSQDDACIAQLKDELFAIDKSVALLRRRFNAFLPANRLSPELLAAIFHFAALIEPHASLSNRRSKSKAKARERLGWITVTQVCHRWRAVAETFAFLWTPISTTLGFGMARQMLHRAAAAPIALELEEHHSSFPKLLHHVFAEGLIAKVQELRYERIIILSSSYLDPVFFPTLLHISIRSMFSSEEEFSSHFPSLQRLELHGIGLVRPSLLRALIFLPTITRLSISVDRLSHELGIPFAQLIAIMSRLPQLEALRISGYHVIPSDDNFLERDVSTPISILNLRTLEFDFSFPHVMVLLHRLHMHPDARLSLNCDFDHVSEILARHALRLLAEACNGKGQCGGYFTALRSLEYRANKAPCYPEHLVSLHSSQGIVISGWRDPSPDYLISDFENGNDSPPTPLPNVRIAFSHSIFRIAPPINLEDFIPFLPLSAMHSLSIQPAEGERDALSSSTWENLARQCRNVEWLRLDGIMAEDFLIAHSGTNLEIDMPKLKTIAFFRVKWPMGSQRMLGSGNAEELLMDMLEERWSRGVPLQRLVMGETPLDAAVFSSEFYESWMLHIEVDCLCRPSWMHEGHPDFTDDLTW